MCSPKETPFSPENFKPIRQSPIRGELLSPGLRNIVEGIFGAHNPFLPAEKLMDKFNLPGGREEWNIQKLHSLG